MLTTIAMALLMSQGQGKPPDAKAVLDGMANKLRQAKSMSGKVSVKLPEFTQDISFRYLPPDRLEVLEKSTEVHFSPDGNFTYLIEPKQYIQLGSYKATDYFAQAIPFVGTVLSAGKELKPKGDVRHEKLDDKPVAAIDVEGADLPGSSTIWIDESTSLPVQGQVGLEKSTIKFIFKDLKLDAEMDPASFMWKPPAGSSEYKQPDMSSEMLKVGSKAPDFKLKRPDGTTYSLKEALKGHKAVLVNFWFYG